MVNKATKLLSAIVLIFLSLYIVTLNNDSMTLRLTTQRSFTTTGGILFIIIFLAGFLTATAIAAVFRMKSLWYEKSLESQQAKRQKFYDGMLHARNLLAAGEFNAATEAWKKIVKSDPSDVIARVELSRCLQGNNEIHEALKELEKARARNSTNTEVLFRAAEINLALNNKTAAIDNLALILAGDPCLRAATMARDLSEELGRLNDALEYHKQAEQLGEPEDTARTIRERLHYELLAEELKHEGADATESRKRLEALLKRFPDSVGALSQLASLHVQTGDIDRAAELLVRAAHNSGDVRYWNKAVQLWLENDMADNAIAAARTATRKTKGKERLQAELELIKIYIGLNRLDDAMQHIGDFKKMANKNGTPVTDEAAQYLLVLKGLCLNQQGAHRDAAVVWRQLSDLNFSLDGLDKPLALPGGQVKALEPRYSTP